MGRLLGWPSWSSWLSCFYVITSFWVWHGLWLVFNKQNMYGKGDGCYEYMYVMIRLCYKRLQCLFFLSPLLALGSKGLCWRTPYGKELWVAYRSWSGLWPTASKEWKPSLLSYNHKELNSANLSELGSRSSLSWASDETAALVLTAASWKLK